VPVGEGRQGIHPRLGPQDDTAPVTAITAVRPAERHILLASEAQTAPTAVTTGHLEMHAVDEHAVSRRSH
jgi:hypothetical protein